MAGAGILVNDEAKKAGEAQHGIVRLLAQDNSQARPRDTDVFARLVMRFYDKLCVLVHLGLCTCIILINMKISNRAKAFGVKRMNTTPA